MKLFEIRRVVSGLFLIALTTNLGHTAVPPGLSTIQLGESKFKAHLEHSHWSWAESEKLLDQRLQIFSSRDVPGLRAYTTVSYQWVPGGSAANSMKLGESVCRKLDTPQNLARGAKVFPPLKLSAAKGAPWQPDCGIRFKAGNQLTEEFVYVSPYKNAGKDHLAEVVRLAFVYPSERKALTVAPISQFVSSVRLK